MTASVLQCANLLLTDSSKGGNALTIGAAGAFSRDFVVRLMTRQNWKALDNIDLNLVSHRYVSGVLKDDHFVVARSSLSRL